MKIGDTVEFWGNEYTAVRYDAQSQTADFMPTDDDKQCRICALEPNYCGKKVSKDDCHGIAAFVFVNSIYVRAMSRI